MNLHSHVAIVHFAFLFNLTGILTKFLSSWSIQPIFILTVHCLFLLGFYSLTLLKSREVEPPINDKNLPQTEATHFSLSPEELEALKAAKKVVAREREKFLKQNNGFVPMASEKVQKYLNEAMRCFELNLNNAISSEGQPWVLQYQNDNKNVKIYSADFPGKPCRRWKIVAFLETDLESAYDAIFLPERRKKWDALVKEVNMLQINDCEPAIGDGLAITSIVTNQVLMVKSRAMLDLALQKCDPKGGIHIANVSCPTDFEESKLNPGIDGAVKAVTHIGSGASLKPIPGKPQTLEYVLVSTIELGGWLPPRVINATMSSSLASSTEQMIDFLDKSKNNSS